MTFFFYMIPQMMRYLRKVYILTRDEKHLSIRTFSDSIKQKVYERQNGYCIKCNNHYLLSEMEADHITPWHEGGGR